MGRRPAQRTASSGNLTVSLPSENVLFLLTRRKEKKKKNAKSLHDVNSSCRMAGATPKRSLYYGKKSVFY